MTATERADGYLTIPASAAEELNGVRWSHRCDAVELSDGSTLALATELALVLEGVFNRPLVPPFAHILSLLMILKRGEPSPEVLRLRRAWSETKREVVVHRNVGLLFRELCRDLPPVTAEPTWEELSAALGRRELFGERRRPELAAEPALPRAAFELRIRSRLQRMDEPTLIHWLTHGCAPTDAGEELAEPVESLVDRMARLLAVARTRPRLVGASVLVPALDAGLTIPPRRRSPDSLPQGGYADVATRGEPEHLLPGQFALDPDEFVRRFAERELLYFRREEPHASQQPERVIVLDQGVRTWGSVRLGLAAAALSLLRQDPKRYGPVRLVLTSTGGPVDLTGQELERLADRVGASDLTPDPGAAVERAILEQAAGPCDLVLLTHPRALREPAVITATKARRPEDRLFALTVDETGQAELSEWTDSGPASVRRFRVDLASAEAARPEGERAHPPVREARSSWMGDVEPIPFPFRVGLITPPTEFGFDADGEWLVMAGREGLLHGLALDGSPPEVLPRAFFCGTALKHVEAILGVPDGAVVCGRLSPNSPTERVTVVSLGPPVMVGAATSSGASFHVGTPPRVNGEARFVAAHYDRVHRRVTVHDLGPAVGVVRWSAFPDLNCIAVTPHDSETSQAGCAVDLSTGNRYPGGENNLLMTRALNAHSRAINSGSPPYTLAVQTRWTQESDHHGGLPYLYLKGNTIHVKRSSPPWNPFEPQQEGKPMLAGAGIRRAQLAGDTLALDLGPVREHRIACFRGPDGSVVREVRDVSRTGGFSLSADGRLIAYCRGRQEVVVQGVTGGPIQAVASPARLHNSMAISLNADPFHLVMRVGTFEHSFRLAVGRLDHTFARRSSFKRWVQQSPLPIVTYDPVRFPSRQTVGDGHLRAASDRFGQVVLGTQTGELIATFLVRRDRAAVWVPGNVYWGAVDLIGGPQTPDAERKIGMALQAGGV